jgi:hypothetical protein
MTIGDSKSKMPFTGNFDAETAKAVMAFQERWGLVADGKVGPVTLSILMEGTYRFLVRHPPRIVQPLDTCWAASMQSALESTWAGLHPHKTIADLVKEYKTLIHRTTHSLTERGLRALAGDLRLLLFNVFAEHFRLESILAELEKNGRQVVMIFPTGVTMRHAVVIFGVHIREGNANLVVMDPQIGDFTEISVGALRAREGNLYFASHNALAHMAPMLLPL